MKKNNTKFIKYLNFYAETVLKCMFRRQFWRENSNSKGKNYRIFQIFEFLCQNCSQMEFDVNFCAKIQIQNWKKIFFRIFQMYLNFVLKSVQIWQEKLKDFFYRFLKVSKYIFFMLNQASFKACKKVLSTIGNEDRCDQSL